MGTREQAVHLLNEAKLSSNAAEKVDHLKALSELVLRKEPALVAEFLPAVLELRVDPGAGVRRYLADFADGALAAAPSPAAALEVLACLAALVDDGAPATARRALGSCYPAFRAALALVALHGAEGGGDAGELAAVWAAARRLRERAAAPAAGHADAGVQLAALKFVEQAAMLLTADVVPAVKGISRAPRPLPEGNVVVGRAALVRDAEQLLALLAGAVRAAAAGDDVPPAAAAAAVRAAGNVVQQRPQFCGKLLPPLMALASSGRVRAGDGSQAAPTLQASLEALLRSTHAMAAPWHKKARAALAAMGAAPPPDAAPAVKQEAPPAGDAEAEQPAKRQKVDGGGAAPVPEATAAAAAAEDAPPPTSAAELQQVLAALGDLAAARDADGLAAYVGSLQPGVLADAVLAALAHLPPREAVPGDWVPPEPWLGRLAELLAALPAEPRPLEAPGGRAPGRAAAKAEPAPAALPALPPDFTFDLAPTELSDEQRAELRRAAVLRIVDTRKTDARALQAALVARLASGAEPGGAAPGDNPVVARLAADLGANFEAAVQWLYVLYVQLVDPGAAAAAAGAGGAALPALEGSEYAAVLLALLDRAAAAAPASDRTLLRLLADAPALPAPGAPDFLRRLARRGPEWATLALLGARDVALQRPPDRPWALALVLEAAADADDDLRGKAVRLAANRLYVEPPLAAAVEAFARARLDEMADGGGGVSAAAAAAPKEEEAEGQDDDAAAAAAEEAQRATAARLCSLYCALCTKKHALLRPLFEAYGRAPSAGRAAVAANAPGLATTVGAAAPALLAVLREPPEGALELALQVLGVLAEAAAPAAPPPAVVAACLALHARSGDARALLPALPGLDRAAALRLLPALLALPAADFRGAVARLVRGAEPGAPGALGPSEVLVALHTLEGVAADAALLRRSMAAVAACLSAPDLFPPEALATAISQLLTRVPLPPLFMRTVIQTLAAAPRLRGFVVGLLGQLAARQVWADAAQWRGWLLAAQQAAPESLPAVLQLPPAVLARELPGLPPDFRRRLAEYARAPGCPVAVPRATLDALAQAAAAAEGGAP